MPPHESRSLAIGSENDLAEETDVSNRLEFGEPSSEDYEYARITIGETPEVRAAALEGLRRTINTRMELPDRTEDEFLIKFLRARSFSVEKAYRLMLRYYSFKEAHPKFHKDVYPLRLTFIGDDDVMSVLPYRDQTGRRTIIYRLGNWKPRNYSVDELFKATVVILELATLEPKAQIMGGVCIFDLSGISLSHACSITPTVASQIVELMGGSFPIRIHAIHVVFQSFLFDMMYALFKPLLDAKTRERIYVHGSDMKSLHTHIDPKFLPGKYGGTRQEYSYNDWVDTLKLDETVIRSIYKLGYKIDPKDDTADMWKKVAESL